MLAAEETGKLELRESVSIEGAWHFTAEGKWHPLSAS